MTDRTALVSGASIAGLSTAYWLARSGWSVTVLERASAFRDGGQNVDVRGVGHRVLDEMGLTDAIRERNTTETGTVFVDGDGRVVAELPSDGPDGPTAELEVLRGDFARVLLEALPEGVEIVYGETIDRVSDEARGVVATTGSGRERVADLLVVAEGVRSRTRGMVFGASVHPTALGITFAFGTIPRTDDDDDRWRWYTMTRGRQVHLRPDPHDTTRAMLGVARAGAFADLPTAEAVARLRELFAGAGWQAERVLDGLEASDDVYVDDLTEIRMPSWRRGRVVVVGDAAWCVTPLGGGGATLALVGGRVLAAALSAGDGLDAAFQRYEDWMRPLVDDVQGVPGAVERFAFPETRAGLAAHDTLSRALTSGPLAGLMARFTQVAQTERELPPLHLTTA